MQKDLVKYRKVFTSIACFHLILISNNSEIAAKYLFDKEGEIINTHIIDKGENNLFLAFDPQRNNNVLISDNGKKANDERVLISEIIIEGWEKHPEGKKLELAAYDSMSIKPGSMINNQILKEDLNSIYASGWFSGVQIKSQDGPLGVRLIVKVVPNPTLKKVVINPRKSVIPKKYVEAVSYTHLTLPTIYSV